LNITNETISQARKGDARAQFLVGNEYYHNNTKADYLKALEWYYRSASNGFSNAQCSLGYMYYTGNKSVPADKQMAIQWYAIAASHGNMGAVQMVQHLNAQGFYAQMDQTGIYFGFFFFFF
jgi:TPR repeat protein